MLLPIQISTDSEVCLAPYTLYLPPFLPNLMQIFIVPGCVGPKHYAFGEERKKMVQKGCQAIVVGAHKLLERLVGIH